MRDEAEKRIGHLYPKIGAWREARTGRYFGEEEVSAWREIESSNQEVGNREELAETATACGHTSISSFLSSLSYEKLTVIAWLWARTVKSPNPAFASVDVPLASTFMLSTKVGKEAYVEPVIVGSRGEEVGNRGEEVGNRAGDDPSTSYLLSSTSSPGYRFTVKVGKPRNAEAAKLGTSAGKRAAFLCLMSGTPLTYDYIRDEGKSGRMGARLMAIVAEGERGRVYLSPTQAHEAIAHKVNPEWKPENQLPDNPRDFKTPNYGLTTFGDLFTPRQLVALTTFSDLVLEARARVYLSLIHI